MLNTTPIFFVSHAKAQADLSIAIDGKSNTVLMPELDCSPNGAVWSYFADFSKFLAIFQQEALGYFGLVFRYYMG